MIFPLQLNKSGVIEGVMTWAKFKAQTELNKIELKRIPTLVFIIIPSTNSSPLLGLFLYL